MQIAGLDFPSCVVIFFVGLSDFKLTNTFNHLGFIFKKIVVMFTLPLRFYSRVDNGIMQYVSESRKMIHLI